MTTYQKARFALAGEGDFIGLHNPEDTWNGWENPLFTIEEARKIALLVEEQNGETADAEGQLFVSPVAVSWVHAEDGEEELMPLHEIDGTHYFAIMNWAWCWEKIGEVEGQ